MSWHYLPGPEAESSVVTCSDGEPWQPSRLKSIHGRFYCNGRLTESYLDSLSGTMLPHSTEDHGEDGLTLSVEDSPARIFPLPGKAPASEANGLAYGQKWPELLAKYDHDSRSWKTAQCSLLGDLEPFSETWPRWGMMQDGVSWELSTPERHTSERGYGFWRTPDASVVSGGAANAEERKRHGHAIGLHDQVNTPTMWPTPMARDYKGPMYEKPNTELRTDYLPNAVKLHGVTSTRQTYPTPRANDGQKRGNIANDPRNGLPAAVKYPTPTNSMVSIADMEQARTAGNSGNRLEYKDAGSGQLNPEWVELLMGWLKCWTCIDPISMIEYKKWQMGFSYEKGTRETETVRELRDNDDQKNSSKRKIGRYENIQSAEVLQSFMCKHKERYNEIGLALAGKEISEEELRMLWNKYEATGSSYRWGLQEPRSGESPDALYPLSQIYPSYGREAWKIGTWESSVPRVGSGIKNRIDRLKAIGNGQVPAVAALAWKILTRDLV